MDTTPPSAITDLIATASSTQAGSLSNGVELRWTAPGDDGNIGIATNYDFRYSTTPITEESWASAIKMVFPSALGEPGGHAGWFIQMVLSPGTTYYFAVRTSDEASNESGPSNVASAIIKFEDMCIPGETVAEGEQIYRLSTHDNPQFGQWIFNPLDVQTGEMQLVTARVRDTEGNPITAVTVTFITDNVFTGPILLSLVSGTAIDGTWQVSWMMPDTYCGRYQAQIGAVSASGESSLTLSFR